MHVLDLEQQEARVLSARSVQVGQKSFLIAEKPSVCLLLLVQRGTVRARVITAFLIRAEIPLLLFCFVF